MTYVESLFKEVPRESPLRARVKNFVFLDDVRWYGGKGNIGVD